MSVAYPLQVFGMEKFVDGAAEKLFGLVTEQIAASGRGVCVHALWGVLRDHVSRVFG
jgi:hypothetical protein